MFLVVSQAKGTRTLLALNEHVLGFCPSSPTGVSWETHLQDTFTYIILIANIHWALK